MFIGDTWAAVRNAIVRDEKWYERTFIFSDQDTTLSFPFQSLINYPQIELILIDTKSIIYQWYANEINCLIHKLPLMVDLPFKASQNFQGFTGSILVK